MKIKVINSIKTGKNIQLLCKEKGLSVRDIQFALQLSSPQSIYKWFSDKYSSIPSIDHIVTLADLLECSIDDLLVVQDLYIDDNR